MTIHTFEGIKPLLFGRKATVCVRDEKEDTNLQHVWNWMM